MKKIAIALRGHERNSFSNFLLKDLIVNLSKIYDLDIYIHTWNFSEAKLSWRELPKERRKIDEDIVKNYFKETNVKNIIIDDDELIPIHGRKTGRLGRIKELSISHEKIKEFLREELGEWTKKLRMEETKIRHSKESFFFLESACPIISWKKMWYGIYSVIKNVHDSNVNYDAVINTRLDILEYNYRIPPKFHINFNVICNLVDNFTSQKKDKIMFTKEGFSFVDNMYVGKINEMNELCQNFFYNLDEILETHHLSKWCSIQEHLVYLESMKYFGNEKHL